MNEDRTVIMSARALSPGHEILWYTIDKVLGQGGFGITYLAHDRNLDRSVAIKEYLPTPFAYRHQDFTVKPLTGDHDDNYTWGLNSFLKEAQTLAKFGHENIVRVHSVFEENNTAYMVMEYEHGDNLASIYTDRSGTLDQGFFERTFFPIFDGLEQIHQFGFIHRDIKPANIYLREDGTPVLIDFGSARQTSQQETGEMTTLVSKGYTPLEQYSANYGDQGPWTDIYALAASLYEGVTGQKPDESLSRSACMLRRKPDLVQRLVAKDYPRFEQGFLDSIINGLALEPEARPQKLSVWLQEFQHGPVDTYADKAVSSMQNKPAEPRTYQNDFDITANTRVAEAGNSRPLDLDDTFSLEEPDDIFGDDMARPAARPAARQMDAEGGQRRSATPKNKSAGKKKTGLILAGLIGLAGAGGAAYFLTMPPTASEPLAVAALNQLPRPASAVATLLPKEQAVQELEDILRLAGEYQRVFESGTPDQELLDGLNAIYDDLAGYASQWHPSRHEDIHSLILRVVETLPQSGQKKQTLMNSLQSPGNTASLDQVSQLLLAGDIATPAGASVMDEVNRLSITDYSTLTNLPQWQQMMSTLNQSAAEKLANRDFTAAARIVEAALSLEPDNNAMSNARAHLSLR